MHRHLAKWARGTPLTLIRLFEDADVTGQNVWISSKLAFIEPTLLPTFSRLSLQEDSPPGRKRAGFFP